MIHTGTPPTGYEVTFHYYDPSATTVQIRGEWYFSNAADTTTTSSQGLLPSEWAPGDFPIAFPNQGPAPNWPVAQMRLNPVHGRVVVHDPASFRNVHLRVLRQLHESATGADGLHGAGRSEQSTVEHERIG